MFEEIKKLKAIQEAIMAAESDDEESAVKSLMKFGLTEEDAKVTVTKIAGFKKQVTDAVLSGRIKSTDDLMKMIEESGIVPKENWNKIMEMMKGEGQ